MLCARYLRLLLKALLPLSYGLRRRRQHLYAALQIWCYLLLALLPSYGSLQPSARTFGLNLLRIRLISPSWSREHLWSYEIERRLVEIEVLGNLPSAQMVLLFVFFHSSFQFHSLSHFSTPVSAL